jgi:hypothetical protein
MFAWGDTEAVSPVLAVVTAAGAVMVGVTGAGATVTVVLADLVASATLVAVMVAVPAAAGAVHAPVALIVPLLAVQVMPVFTAPLTELLKATASFTVTVGLAGLMAATTTV